VCSVAAINRLKSSTRIGSVSALVVGLAAGALVAAQVGPVTLLLVRTVLRGAVAAGLAFGAAVAVVDLLYAAAGLAGAGALLAIEPLRLAFGLLGAVVLVVIGVRTLASAHRLRLGAELPSETATPWAAFRTGVVATASNPLTIASWAGVFAAASVAGAASTPASTVALLLGVGLGSAGWYLLLIAALLVARRRIGRGALVVVDGVAGIGLIGFGGLLGWRSLID
jgi:putative LysE/RhtB family amino acid efflux pump